MGFDTNRPWSFNHHFHVRSIIKLQTGLLVPPRIIDRFITILDLVYSTNSTFFYIFNSGQFYIKDRSFKNKDQN